MPRTSVITRLLSDEWSFILDGLPIQCGRYYFHLSANILKADCYRLYKKSLAKDYPTCMRQQLGDRLPEFTDSEFALLREADIDFYGMNYYTSQFARHRDETPSKNDYLGNIEELQENKEGVSVGEPSGVSWLQSTPKLFRKHLARVYHKYGKPIYVTENGCPCPGEEKMTVTEAVNDIYRIRYFEDHIEAVALACSEDGCDIKGYFAWSLMDNLGMDPRLYILIQATIDIFLEWSDGYGVRFGATFTDYGTLQRTPKQSALLLKGMFEKYTEPRSRI